jgi:hypothetical protein
LTGPEIWHRNSCLEGYRKQDSHCHLGKTCSGITRRGVTPSGQIQRSDTYSGLKGFHVIPFPGLEIGISPAVTFLINGLFSHMLLGTRSFN